MDRREPLGARHPEIARLRRLTGRRSARREDGCFVVEGHTLLAELLASDLHVETVYHSVDADPPDDVPTELLQPVAAGVLERALDTVTSRGVAAVAAIPESDPGEVLAAAAAAERPVVVAVELADPGNLGTIVRAAEASGCAALLATERTVDLWSPKVVRSAAGATFRLPVLDVGLASGALRACEAAGFATVALVLDGDATIDAVDLSGAAAIVVGNEAHGLAQEVADACTTRARIVMEGPTESLNVAMATTVVCFEAMRQRRALA